MAARRPGGGRGFTPASERSPAPGVTTVGNPTVPRWRLGDRVTHDEFGLGTVVSAETATATSEAKIDFGGEYGVKRLVLRSPWKSCGA